ncbi:MAG TPA: prenyltransferase/squalene oxidase repeat-containing protein [Gemmataceae bacterium]|nr:prenyltransferase/squalene oxidase repeat-containing protein [Gemmataceae bacterium]
MKRSLLAVVCLGVVLGSARGQTAEQKAQTVHFLRSLQQADGGFPNAPASQTPSSLRATSAALRALKYWGGEPKDLPAAAKFIARCYDQSSGGFADQPGGKPDVFSTAVGLMAVVEAKLPLAAYSDGAVKYLAENAKTFEEVRIAVAGLEAIGTLSPRLKEWRQQVAGLLNPDGTAGKGEGAARETGSVIVALLRMGAAVENKDQVLKVLRAGQRADGGFGKADAKGSDLETSYRVMRAFHMLKSKPDSPERLREFVAKCRNADGGYGVAPGQPSLVAGTYYAGIIGHWLDQK